MLTMLIAEDDRLERESLQEVGDVWERLGIAIAGTAENGLQALEITRRLQPDILLTDIRMPQMNGLELAQAVRQEGLHTLIVLVSGYEDFSYAKAGIQAGVVAYLLKPYTIAELGDTLREAAEKCLAEKRRRREESIRETLLAESLPLLEEKFLENALYGRYRDGAELISRMHTLGLDFSGREFLLMLLRMEPGQNAQDATQNPMEMLSLMALVQESTAAFAYRRIIPGSRSDYLVLLGDCPDALRDKRTVERVAQDICRSLAMERDAHPIIGISRPAAGIAGLAQAYREVCEAAEHSFTLGRDRAIFYDDIASPAARYPNVSPHAEAMLQALRAGNEAQAGAALDALFLELRQHRTLTCEYAANVCLSCYLQAMLAVTETLGDGIPACGDRQLHCEDLYRCRTLPQLHERMRALMGTLGRMVAERMQQRMSDTVLRVKEIIARKYMQDITLETIASEVYLSPNYLNTVFRRGTGTSISKWLTDTRIHRAVELLGDPQAPIGQIAGDVGYSNAAYFSTVFKKHTGLTPLEFRSRAHTSQDGAVP